MMNKKTILTTFVLTVVTASTFAAGLENTVNPTAAHYGAEAYGYTNTITAAGRSAFVTGYNNTVSANNALVYGVGNKAEGINSLVGGEYAKATGRNSVAIGSHAEALQDNTFAIGSQARTSGTDALAFGNGAYAENTATVAIGKTVKATEEGALAIGFNTEATARDAIAIGGNVKEPGDTLAIQKTTASGRQSIALGYKANSKGVSGISIGTNAYSEGRGAVSIGSWSIASGDGATAVGGGYARADRAVVVGSGNADGKESVSVGSYSRVYAEGAVGIGKNVFIDDSATNSVAIGSSSETISKKNVTAIGSNTYSEVENSVALGTSARADEVVSTSSANIAGKTYNFAGKTADGTVSIGGKIISGYETDRYGMPIFDDNGNMIPIVDKTAYRTITNVAAGRISDTSTDAVNGSQLNAAIKGIDKNHQDIVDTAKGLQMLGDVVADHEVAIAANKQSAADAMEEAKKHTIVKAGDNITVTEDSGTYTVSTAKDLTDMNSINLNDGNSESHYTIKGMDMTYRGDFEYHTQYNYDGMHIKVNDADTQAIRDEISLTDKGLNNGNNKIINVSRGENDTDAVNVSQLKETNKKVDDNTKVIGNHEGRITDLEHKTIDVGRNVLERANHYTDLQVNKGVAKASALAGLKYLDYNPKDKWSFAASVGHYRNANAVAVGAAYQPNENTMIHGGITVDGEVAYNLGVSFKTGGQKYINKYELAEQVRQLQSDNVELRQELNELRSMIKKNK